MKKIIAAIIIFFAISFFLPGWVVALIALGGFAYVGMKTMGIVQSWFKEGQKEHEIFGNIFKTILLFAQKESSW
jgi:hypothetical protein